MGWVSNALARDHAVSVRLDSFALAGEGRCCLCGAPAAVRRRRGKNDRPVDPGALSRLQGAGRTSLDSLGSSFTDWDAAEAGRFLGVGADALCLDCLVARARHKEPPITSSSTRMGQRGWLVSGSTGVVAIPVGVAGLEMLAALPVRDDPLPPATEPFIVTIGGWQHGRHYWLRAAQGRSRLAYPVLRITAEGGGDQKITTHRTVWIRAAAACALADSPDKRADLRARFNLPVGTEEEVLRAFCWDAQKEETRND